MRVVGVGLGRTGTHSLKIAVEQLLAAPCHHMVEVIGNSEQMRLWTAAANGQPDWPAIFSGYSATVDWPGAGFWRELVEQYPNAVVLLSKRTSAEAWWKSANGTIFEMLRRPAPDDPELAELKAWFDAVPRILVRNGVDVGDAAASKAAYERHLDSVRTEVPAERLVEWTVGDGWAPLCQALGVSEPDEPFPHVNTTDEFRAMFSLGSPST